MSVVDECAAAGVKSLVVITAGFAEAGPEGIALQRRLTEKVRLYGMRMVGPNCMGLLNASPVVSLNASFSPLFPPSGRIGLLSQSGALGLTILSLASDRGLGLSTFVSVGNKADVSGNDLLEYLGERSVDVGDAALPRIVRQPAALRASGAAHRPAQAHRGREVGTDPRRQTGGQQPHCGARGQ